MQFFRMTTRTLTSASAPAECPRVAPALSGVLFTLKAGGGGARGFIMKGAGIWTTLVGRREEGGGRSFHYSHLGCVFSLIINLYDPSVGLRTSQSVADHYNSVSPERQHGKCPTRDTRHTTSLLPDSTNYFSVSRELS